MNRCFSQEHVAITSQTVQELGAMVTKLPIEKLETVSAADLAQTVESIKQNLKATKKHRKRDRRRNVVSRQIAKKVFVIGSGI